MGGHRTNTRVEMDELQLGLDNLQVTGANLNTLLIKLHTDVDHVRTAKLGARDPKDKWVAPLYSPPLLSPSSTPLLPPPPPLTEKSIGLMGRAFSRR